MVEVSGAFDFVLLLVLVVPGFISYVVLRYLAVFEEVPTDLHTVLYSLILSMLNYLPLSFLFSIIDMDSLRKMALSPAYVFASFLVSAGMGCFIGLIAKTLLHRAGMTAGSPWDHFARDHVGRWVIVVTTDNKEYKGWVKSMTLGRRDKKEIILGDPKLLHRNTENHRIERRVKVGAEMLITEQSVSRIIRLYPKNLRIASTSR
jgi:hypothetical protein